MGIRDGDRAVLRALVDRRGSAVLAFCERACVPSEALDAAADAFSGFRATVLASDQPARIDPEAALLAATRRAAAARSPRPAADGGSALGRLMGSPGAGGTLDRVPDLLARRAEGTLSPDEADVLDALLDSSPVARAIESRFTVAEEAYRAAPRQALPDPIADQIVTTMAALEAAPPPDAPDVAPDVVPDVGEDASPEPAPEPEPAEPADASPEPDATVEWSVPVDQEGDDLGVEIAAARLGHDEEEDPAHLQSASGAVEEEPEPFEELVVEEEPVGADEPTDGEEAFAADEPVAEEEPLPDEDAPPAAEEPPAEEEPLAEGEPLAEDEPAPDALAEEELAPLPPDGDGEGDQDDEHAPPRPLVGAAPAGPVAAAPAPPAERHGHDLPGRAALAPAAAVVAIATIGAMAASGIFGGSDPSPPLDTGIVPERALQAVPEGEAATVVDDLRSAASDARRRRLADQRQAAISQQLQPAPAPPVQDDAPAQGGANSSSAPPAGEDSPADEDDTASGAGDAAGDAGADEEPADGPGGTSAEDATGGGTESP